MNKGNDAKNSPISILMVYNKGLSHHWLIAAQMP